VNPCEEADVNASLQGHLAEEIEAGNVEEKVHYQVPHCNEGQ
jgi:hypothetical protein